MSKWKVLNHSVIGSSHRDANLPCQDYCAVREIDTCGGAVLIVVCADGAGSASHSHLGAHLTCELFVTLISEYLQNTNSVATLEVSTALEWCERVQCALQLKATEFDTTLRQLACTLLVAVVARDTAVFFQIGDGVIVWLDEDVYYPVFWPERGEYANTTSFITQPNIASSLVFQLLEGGVEEFAVLTDGLQMLALEYDTKAVHQRFFMDMFMTLREYEDVEQLASPFQRFLDSEKVNERTDDDKTLVLATRVGNSVGPG